ncbi:MAG: hypothetical protein ACD_62C00043G0005 [uncultured bacterium]|nr:MAG: hypothetical protein ACD_62C00043G0005 [uncultured bacterium]HLD44849.1 nucleotidyltransferase substrate binding protein [bacterium]
MVVKKNVKLLKSLNNLKSAVRFYEKDTKAPDEIRFIALSKAFEVCVEYAWKELKTRVEEEGLDAESPKETIRQSARIGLIASAEIWLDFISVRNEGVHDYFDIPESDYLELAKCLLKECNKHLLLKS